MAEFFAFLRLLSVEEALAEEEEEGGSGGRRCADKLEVLCSLFTDGASPLTSISAPLVIGCWSAWLGAIFRPSTSPEAGAVSAMATRSCQFVSRWSSERQKKLKN